MTWPASTGLLVSEVMTGGASASDEFIEIYNASDQAVQVKGFGLELSMQAQGSWDRQRSRTRSS